MSIKLAQGHSRVGTDEGYHHVRGSKDKLNPFNSTSPRFNYRKQTTKLEEVPGPGSYDFSLRDKSNTTCTFKDTTERMDDLKGYRGKAKAAEDHVGPSSYHSKQPFLKRTFNTSLPLGNFY